LERTIADPAEHGRFAAFHNGITILTRAIDEDPKGKRLTLHGVGVVNGCQSLLALSRQKAVLTPELLLPVRVVAIGRDGGLSAAPSS